MWTTERPTKAGWWWFREQDVATWRVVEVRVMSTMESPKVHFTNGRVESVCHLQGEWQPVQPPQD